MADIVICEEEESIAVGSTGTLLSLIGKEMEILQARKSFSLHKNIYYGSQQLHERPSAFNCNRANYVCGRSSNHNHLAAASSPAFHMNAPPDHPSSTCHYTSSSIVSSWLKGLLRSPNLQLHKHHESPLLMNTAGVSHDHYLHLQRSPPLLMRSDEDADDDDGAQVQLALFDRRSSTASTTPPRRKHPPRPSAAAGGSDVLYAFRKTSPKEENRAKSKLAVDAGTAESAAAASPRAMASKDKTCSRADYNIANDADYIVTASTGKPARAKAGRPELRYNGAAGSRKSRSAGRSSWRSSGGPDERELCIKSYDKESAKISGSRSEDERRPRAHIENSKYCECDDADDESLIAFGDVHHRHVQYFSNAAAMVLRRLQQPAEEPFTPASTPDRRSNLAAISTVVDLQCCHTTTTTTKHYTAPTSSATSFISLRSPASTRRLSFSRLISHS